MKPMSTTQLWLIPNGLGDCYILPLMIMVSIKLWLILNCSVGRYTQFAARLRTSNLDYLRDRLLFTRVRCSIGIDKQSYKSLSLFNTLRPIQNGRHFADDTFKHIFLNENIRISIKMSLKCVPKVPINNIPALVQIMAWRRPGDKPLSEPMMVCLLTHMCVTRPQRVKPVAHFDRNSDFCGIRWQRHLSWCV